MSDPIPLFRSVDLITPTHDQPRGEPFDKGGGGGDDGRMQSRVTALETKWDTVIPTLATRSDVGDLRTEMHKGFSDMVKWIVGSALGVAVGGITVMAFVLNNAVPKVPVQTTVQPAPIIINVPGIAAPAPAVKASGP